MTVPIELAPAPRARRVAVRVQFVLAGARAAVMRAGPRPLRFHDLRHTFGTRVIGVADIRRVQEWMGHANVQTTMQHLHYVPRPQDAALVGEAFPTGPSGRGRPLDETFDEQCQGRLVWARLATS
jgi:hypothetical protein